MARAGRLGKHGLRAQREHLGVGISYLMNLLNPQMIVIGGGVVDGSAHLIDSVRASSAKHTLNHETVKIAPSALGIPTDMYTVGTRGEGSEAGTTLTGSFIPGFDSPLAGHADETSTTHLVGKTGFERLSAYLRAGEVPRCRDFVVDGTTGTVTQVPGTGSC